MDVQQMYEEFRSQYAELTKATDARHVKIWGSVGHESVYSWFESLANTLNAQMGNAEQRTDFTSIFEYFDMKLRTGSKEVKHCIDVSFVENLFWQVSSQNAAPIWAILPTNLQQLYIDFHGRSPKLD